MYRNQFYATTGRTSVPFPDWQQVTVGPLRIFAHPALETALACGLTHVIVLGIILDPYRPERSGQDIVDELAESGSSGRELIHRLSLMCGRFVTIAATPEGCFVLGDACGFRTLIYGTEEGELHIGSNLKLILETLGLQPEPTGNVTAHRSSDRFEHLEHAWFGDTTPDRRFRRVLPNHRLNVDVRSTARLPARDFTGSGADEETVVAHLARVLSGTIAALHHRAPIILPLSAGLDTRMLLAASRPLATSITYYTVADDATPVDTQIARELASRFALPFVELRLKPVRPDLESKFKRTFLQPRLLRNARFIQALADQWQSGEVLNVTGNGAEILRCFYGHTNGRVTPDMLRSFSGYGKSSALVNSAIDAWLPEARRYARSLGISVLDLFYWEQRIGNWGAAFPGELDLLMDEISPFTQRSLLLNVLNLPAGRRNAPKYALFRRLIKSLWPDILEMPVNPHIRPWKKRLLSNAYLRYVLQKSGLAGP